MLAPLSIRWRLAVITAALTFLILTLFAIVIGQLTATRVRSDFNNQLAAAVDELRDRLQVGYENGVPIIRTGLNTYAASNDAVIRVLSPNGRIIGETERAPNFGLPRLPAERTTQIGDFRVESRDATIPGSQFVPRLSVVVQYARRVSEVEATVGRVRAFLLGGVLGGTALALLGALALAKRSLAPIARLTATARSIQRTGDPDASVPIPDTEDEVAELAQTLDDMLRSLTASRSETQEMLDRQRQFVADASHELRTPLTSVLANLELLADVLDGDRGEAARSALRSSHRMKRLVADLLLLARADANRQSAPHEPIDLSQVALEAVAEIGAQADDHELTVATDPVVVRGARDDLHRVVVNLLENALRYTPVGSHVTLSITERGGRARIEVEDDGPGIPADLRERIFERFVRGDDDCAKQGSFGLGLSIVHAVAEAHGGAVRIEDPDGGGTRFVVELPAVGVAVGVPA